jgi:hypothetical protein
MVFCHLLGKSWIPRQKNSLFLEAKYPCTEFSYFFQLLEALLTQVILETAEKMVF